MDIRLMLLLYGGAAAGLTWLVCLGFAAWRQSDSPLRVAPLAMLSAIVVVVAIEFVKLQVFSLPLDLAGYRPSARLVMLLVFGIVGRLSASMGQRRWRSGTSLKETRAAYRTGQLWDGFDSAGKFAIWMAFVAMGVALALPEWFLGF